MALYSQEMLDLMFKIADETEEVEVKAAVAE
jgi:hypothetical protein